MSTVAARLPLLVRFREFVASLQLPRDARLWQIAFQATLLTMGVVGRDFDAVRPSFRSLERRRPRVHRHLSAGCVRVAGGVIGREVASRHV